MSAGTDERGDGALDAALARSPARHVAARVPGLAAVVVRRGEPARRLLSGLADRDAGRPVTAHTVFAWYSLTKIVVAATALRLVERGLLDLDAPARAHVPALTLVERRAAARAVTVRDLLGHGAGFADPQRHVARWFRAPDAPFPEPRAFLAEQLRRHGTLRAAPGTRLRYSNLGFAVLGELLAAVAGRPFRTLVHDEVLAPLGMRATGFEGGAAREDRARGYVRRTSALGVAVRLLDRAAFTDGRSGRFRRLRWRDLALSPHGGLLGPLDDLERFLRVFVDVEARDEHDARTRRLLAPASLASMGTLALRDGRARSASCGTGLGWFVEERPRVPGARGVLLRHGGRGPGFTTEMAVLPEHGLAVGVLGNTEYDAKAVACALLASELAPPRMRGRES